MVGKSSHRAHTATLETVPILFGIVATRRSATARRRATSSSPRWPQSFERSVWHDVHGFGTPSRFVATGDTNSKVWLRTLTLPTVRATSGMWHAAHLLPSLPAGAEPGFAERHAHLAATNWPEAILGDFSTPMLRVLFDRPMRGTVVVRLPRESARTRFRVRAPRVRRPQLSGGRQDSRWSTSASTSPLS